MVALTPLGASGYGDVSFKLNDLNYKTHSGKVEFNPFKNDSISPAIVDLGLEFQIMEKPKFGVLIKTEGEIKPKMNNSANLIYHAVRPAQVDEFSYRLCTERPYRDSGIICSEPAYVSFQIDTLTGEPGLIPYRVPMASIAYRVGSRSNPIFVMPELKSKIFKDITYPLRMILIDQPENGKIVQKIDPRAEKKGLSFGARYSYEPRDRQGFEGDSFIYYYVDSRNKVVSDNYKIQVKAVPYNERTGSYIYSLSSEMSKPVESHIEWRDDNKILEEIDYSHFLFSEKELKNGRGY